MSTQDTPNPPAGKETHTLQFPKDVNGITVKVGDKVKGEGCITFQDGFKIELYPTVTVNIQNGVLYFGQLSASSFDKFWILNTITNG